MDYSFAKSNIASATNYHDLSGLSSIKNDKDQESALKKVAQQFESLFVNELLKNMRNANAVFEKDSLMSGGDTNTFRDMYDQQLSVHLSSGRGLGLSDVIYKQLSRQYLQDNEGGSKVESFEVPARKEFDNAVAPESVVQDHSSMAEAEVNKPAKPEKSVFSSAKEFIDELMPMAEKVAKQLAVHPAMLIAQAALETGWGKHITESKTGEPSFNLFNIKSSNAWSGETVAKNSAEFINGDWIQQQSDFRKYKNFSESFDDFYQFLTTNPRYKNAVTQPRSSEQFIQHLQNSGYATDPNYANKVLDIYKSIVGNPASKLGPER